MSRLRILVYGGLRELFELNLPMDVYFLSGDDPGALLVGVDALSVDVDVALIESSRAHALAALEMISRRFPHCQTVLVVDGKHTDVLIKALELGLDRHMVRGSSSATNQALLEGTLKTIARRCPISLGACSAQLRHANRMQSTAQLARVVAHDFNNLLTVISSYGYMMQSEVMDQPDLARHLSKIMEAAQRASELARQLVSVRQRRGQPNDGVNLNACILAMRPTLELLLGKNINLEFELCPTSPWIDSHEDRIQQGLMNLALNAREAMPKGGKVVIRTFNRTANDGSSEVVLEFCDSGQGMEKHVQARIFEPFFTTRNIEEASGIGLSIWADLVREDRGRIEVESTVDQGTMLRMSWPAIDQAEALVTPAAQ